MIDRNKFESLADALASVEDLDKVKAALVREQVIRQCVKETGESREIVVEMLGAFDSMAQEAVTALTDGDPTTLREALIRYVESLQPLLNDDPNDEEARTRGEVVDALSAILAYPFPEADQEPPVVLQPAPDTTRVLVEVAWNGTYYQPAERFAMVETWIRSALSDRDDSPEPTIRDLDGRDVEVVRTLGDSSTSVAPGLTCTHGAAVAEESPSVFHGAAPVRTFTDGCQSYGPYRNETP